MKNPWFRKGFDREYSRVISGEKVDKKNGEVELVRSKSLSNPPFYNAFKFISSMSSRLDLSSLFESKRKSYSMFTSKFSASDIMGNLATMAKKLNFGVSSAKEFWWDVKYIALLTHIILLRL
ncbi:hypothetical protein QYF36_022786 [Acer negundo]|nr:hypothetical protein QYF36_022786 [Acer negundo]